jgi:hypothetical protein
MRPPVKEPISASRASMVPEYARSFFSRLPRMINHAKSPRMMMTGMMSRRITMF